MAETMTASPTLGSLRICAWCKKPMGHADDGDPSEITHGICEACSDAVLKGYKAGKA